MTNAQREYLDQLKAELAEAEDYNDKVRHAFMTQRDEGLTDEQTYMLMAALLLKELEATRHHLNRYMENFG